ncbi:MAG: hypothetical protein K0Q56_397 [Sporolactobacillus laevolacticus]|jgi:hypothetical protein|nr:hypothetical protein [Sporolactobacillus laevolacticus]
MKYIESKFVKTDFKKVFIYYQENRFPLFWLKYLILIVLFLSPIILGLIVVHMDSMINPLYHVILLRNKIESIFMHNSFLKYYWKSIALISFALFVSDFVDFRMITMDMKKLVVVEKKIGDINLKESSSDEVIIEILNTSDTDPINYMKTCKKKILDLTSKDVPSLELLKIYFERFEHNKFFNVWGSTILTLFVAVISLYGKSNFISTKIYRLLSGPSLYVVIKVCFVLIISSSYFSLMYYLATSKQKKCSFIIKIIELCIEEEKNRI